MKHSPVRKGSLPAMQKATRLRGDGGSVPGHSPAVGEVQQEENRSHNQSQDETRTRPFCWPWMSFTSPNSSGTYRQRSPTPINSSRVRRQMPSGGVGSFSMMALMWLCTVALCPPVPRTWP